MPADVLPRSFYDRPTAGVARDLLGMRLVHGRRSGRIVEVEAYLPGDAAAHAFRGRTKRTEVIFGAPGHAYVYLIYGMYHCLNFVTEPEGVPGCVLIRGVESQGDGPGKLTRAMGIDLKQYGADLTRGPLTVRRGQPARRIEVTPRIGIKENVDWPLRFVLRDN